MPPASSSAVQSRLLDHGAPVRALEGMAAAISKTWDGGKGSKVFVVSSGPMTNVALFVSVYPELLEAVGGSVIFVRRLLVSEDMFHPEEFVFMGGGVGVGNRSASAGQPEINPLLLTAHI